MATLVLAHPTASLRRRRAAGGIGRRSIVEVASTGPVVPKADLRRIARIRLEIDRGAYDTLWRMRVALDRLIDSAIQDGR